MGLTVAEKLIQAHLVSGRMAPGQEIGLRIDQTLTQDATGTMAYLQFEAMGVPKVRTELSVSYVDHNTLQDGFENADDHKYLQTVAASYYANPANATSPYDSLVVPRPDKGGYALELPPTLSADQVAHLTGLGDLGRLDESTRREIAMALSLTPSFRWAKQIHPTSPWVYYVSARGFVCLYPWVSPEEYFISPSMLTREFYNEGLPKNNLDRHAFITEVYLDEYGQGLMVTLSAPVYEGDSFRGVVALDFALMPWSGATLSGALPALAVWGLCGWGFVVSQQHRLVEVVPARAGNLTPLFIKHYQVGSA